MSPEDAEPQDAELMHRFGAGDDEAFRTLVRRHERALLHFFHRRCLDRAQAEDLAQEVFLRIVRHRGSWRPDAKFTTYMYRIAENLWIDRWRSRKAAPREASLEDELPGSGADGDDGGSLGTAVAAPGSSPAELSADRELAAKIRRAVARLPEEQRAVFTMAEVRGMKYQDIAEVLEVPVGTVKSRMHAATAKLRTLLEAEGLAL